MFLMRLGPFAGHFQSVTILTIISLWATPLSFAPDAVDWITFSSSCIGPWEFAGTYSSGRISPKVTLHFFFPRVFPETFRFDTLWSHQMN